jgi:hypothetical protein
MWEVISQTLGLTKPKVLDAPLVEEGKLGTLYIYGSHLYLHSIFEQFCSSIQKEPIKRECDAMRYHNCSHLKSWFEIETNYEKVNKWYFIGVWKIQIKPARDRPTQEIPYPIKPATHAVVVLRGGRFHNTKGKLSFRHTVFCGLYDVLHFGGELDESIVVLVRSIARKLLTQGIDSIDWEKEMSRNKYIRSIRKC